MTLIEIYEKKAKEIWQNFIKLDGIKEIYSPDTFKKEILNDIQRVHAIQESTILCSASVGINGPLNYFIVHDPAYGNVCEKCKSDAYVVLIMDNKHLDNLDKKIFLPSFESYYLLGIHPVDNEGSFTRMFPVPVNYKTDYWYCPNCNELHKFNYDNIIGLTYNQEII